MSRAVRKAYRAGREDETLPPLVLCDAAGLPVGRLGQGDSVIFYNIRGEREGELTESLTNHDFRHFPVVRDLGLRFATMIPYGKDLDVRVAFPAEDAVRDTLGDVLARHGIPQIRVTEAEKAVHAGFFLSGKRTGLLPGEERIVIPTRKDVALFDEAPEMSIAGITGAVREKLGDPAPRFVFVNLPNVDVVSHIENEGAVLLAVEAVDRAAGALAEAALRKGWTVVVTADHGSAEKWFYPDGAVDTGHTDSPVPLCIVGPEGPLPVRPRGSLIDVAPTVLELLGLPVPDAMTGRSLLPQDGAKPRAERLLLLLLDGWGWNPGAEGNLLAKADTPFMDGLLAADSHAALDAAGEAVGLPAGTVGNSEAGHLHIGAGRVIYSDRVRIDRAISDGSFFENDAFRGVAEAARRDGKALHLMGIVSFFSSHGSLNHLYALMDLARRAGPEEVYIHAMLGRRGEQPESGARYIEQVERRAWDNGRGRVVSVIGRYWSMDREENWDRIEKTYRMLVHGEGTPVPGK
jgi:2,3-bisphosphoglycerate-independent phosphoglycerate mutase